MKPASQKIPAQNAHPTSAQRNSDSREAKVGIFIVTCLIVLTALTGCGGGGGGSSTGGGEGVSFAGSYSGPCSVTVAATGAGSFTEPCSILIVINVDATVDLDPDMPAFSGSGTISGNQITASYPASIANSPGLVCTGTIAVNATVEGTMITGTFGPSVITCNGVAFTVTGTITATLTAKAPLQSETLGSQIRELVQQTMGQ